MYFTNSLQNWLPTIMVTRPRKQSDATEYTYLWAENAVKMSRNMGYPVVDIQRDEVNYDNVNKSIDQYKPALVVHYGHGCPSSLQGQKECILTQKIGIQEMMSMSRCDLKNLFQPLRMSASCENNRICKLHNETCFPLCSNETNINKLGGAIIYAVACHSTKELGRYAIRYGAQSYVGYDDLLLFPTDTMKSEIMFGDIQNLFLQKLLEGYSVMDSYQIMSDVEDKYIRFYKTIKYVGLPMLWNRKHRQILGNPYANLV